MHTSTNAVQALDVPAAARVTSNARVAHPNVLYDQDPPCKRREPYANIAKFAWSIRGLGPCDQAPKSACPISRQPSRWPTTVFRGFAARFSWRSCTRDLHASALCWRSEERRVGKEC